MIAKLLYLVSHPIQYQAPLLRRIAAEDRLTLRVLFGRVPGDGDVYDPGFGRDVVWDVPLLDGYDSAALADSDLASEIARCDVLWLHGWQSRNMRRALSIADKLGKPVLMRGENCGLANPDGRGPKGWLKRTYLSRIFEKCTVFLTIGAANADYYLDHGVPPDRLVPVPYAVDNDFFSHSGDPAALRSELGLADGQPVVLFAGKLLRRKHPEHLARALARTPWPEGSPAPALVFAGDGEMADDLRRIAPEAHFLGFRNQTELPAYYGLADVFVLPSEREPWGLAVNEAMASGTAVIVSDEVGCARDLVDGTCGEIYPFGDIGRLSQALVRCVANADDLGAAAGAKISAWNFAADIEGLNQAVEKVLAPS